MTDGIHSQEGFSMFLNCPAHGPVEPALGWSIFSNGTTHLGAYCPACEQWIKWVAQTDKWLTHAPTRPEQGQLI